MNNSTQKANAGSPGIIKLTNITTQQLEEAYKTWGKSHKLLNFPEILLITKESHTKYWFENRIRRGQLKYDFVKAPGTMTKREALQFLIGTLAFLIFIAIIFLAQLH